MAVSGGVDSVVLLDMLTKQPGLKLIVAHFDHGIRPDSSKDRIFVANLSQKYNVPFEYETGNLGTSASEDQARTARYAFLRRVRKKYNADAIVTAHHQDDVIETMFINILRGTKQKGLISLASKTDIVRPLLAVSKRDITNYAKKHNLVWHEDSTNADTRYVRNWLRHTVLPRLSQADREHLVSLYEKTKATDAELLSLLDVLGAQNEVMDRKVLMALPHDAAKEYVAQWLRNQGVRGIDHNAVERLVIGGKTLPAGKSINVKKDIMAQITTDTIELAKLP